MNSTKTDTQALILALSSLEKMGPVRVRVILGQVENPLELIDWSTRDWEQVPGISSGLAEHIKARLDIGRGRKIIEWAGESEFSLVTVADDDYPASLREIYDRPPYLFFKGDLIAADSRAVAIVGSRSATDYGRSMAARIAGDLSRHGVTVVSGMAIGIDSTAHRAALEAGGRTVAVLGSGIDVIYPPSNKKLYHRIAEQGVVVSEFLPGTDPSPGHFPRRNRIIAGLSQAVVVVEAGEKSGALLTADLALTQEKKLFAVPGNLSSRMSSGTNDLIKSGAYLLSSAEDIFSVLPTLKNDYIVPRQIKDLDLTDGESIVFEHLSGTPKQLDSLVRECRLTVTDTASYLLSLELRGLVRQLSGKRFIAI